MAYTVEENTWIPGYYFINFSHPKHSRFPNTGGHYTIFPARLFGLSYEDYLKLTRVEYGAEMWGKQGGIITPIFKDKKDAIRLQKELGRRYLKISQIK